MAKAFIPGSARLSDAAEYRNLIFTQDLPRLQNFAWRALNVLNKKNDEVVVVCIQVDSRWRDLVDTLMPGYDWGVIRATGADPIARGTAGWGVCRFVAEDFPDLAQAALEVPEEGKLKAIVLTDEGCTIHDIEPKPHDAN